MNSEYREAGASVDRVLTVSSTNFFVCLFVCLIRYVAFVSTNCDVVFDVTLLRDT